MNENQVSDSSFVAQNECYSYSVNELLNLEEELLKRVNDLLGAPDGLRLLNAAEIRNLSLADTPTRKTAPDSTSSGLGEITHSLSSVLNDPKVSFHFYAHGLLRPYTPFLTPKNFCIGVFRPSFLTFLSSSSLCR